VISRDLFCAALRSQDAFVVRAVRFLAAEIGVRQFLDVGSGISDGTMLHTYVQQVTPAARCVYMTSDPVILGHFEDAPAGAGRGSVDVFKGGLGDVGEVIEHAAGCLNLDAPIAAFVTGVLHLLPDTNDSADPYRVVAQLVEAMAAGSYLVVAHLASDVHPGVIADNTQELAANTHETWQFRNRKEVGRFLAGLDVVEPGVIQADWWRTDAGAQRPTYPYAPLWAGVGRKP
jgi:hypothetical protein